MHNIAQKLSYQRVYFPAGHKTCFSTTEFEQLISEIPSKYSIMLAPMMAVLGVMTRDKYGFKVSFERMMNNEFEQCKFMFAFSHPIRPVRGTIMFRSAQHKFRRKHSHDLVSAIGLVVDLQCYINGLPYGKEKRFWSYPHGDRDSKKKAARNRQPKWRKYATNFLAEVYKQEGSQAVEYVTEQ